MSCWPIRPGIYRRLAAATREFIAPLAERTASGTLKVSTDAVVALEQAVDGLAAIAAGKARSKTVVDFA